MEAWITSALEDEDIAKAIILAGSLRRVYTAKKLVVFTSASVSQNLREQLRNAFDLVFPLEQTAPNGLSLEDYAKVEAFSFLLFKKCVHLSPNTLVLKNCDDIFDKYHKFAVLEGENGMDSSVYLFTPSLEGGQALSGILDVGGSPIQGIDDGDKTSHFISCFQSWIRNNIPNWEKLDEEYNFRLNLQSGIPKSLKGNVSIVNFEDAHPLGLLLAPEGSDEKLQHQGIGIIETLAIDLCWKIYTEDFQSNMLDFDQQPIQPNIIFKTEPIAIVGMSFRLPGGNNVEEFWDLLSRGKEAIRLLPESRWSREHTYLPCQNRKVEAGFLSIPVDEFDAKFFGISGKEAEYLDPQQRLLHEVAWEALEDAMIDPSTLQGTQTGIFVGSWLQDYKDMLTTTTDLETFRMYMGNSIAAGAARLSHFLETTGPSIGTESGCSSAIVAVDMACKSLRNRDSNLALACGVNLFLHPFDSTTMSFVIAPDGRCKTFDEGANGFGRAEGCAVLVIKRLSDAVRDGDNIWGLIRGSAITQEGVSKSLGTPTVHGESLAMELALQDADVDPADVSYVEAHGTGTPVGDPLEIAAITKTYSSKGRSEPLVIGSVKTNVGHTESVSGITGIIKVLLSMKNGLIPKHLNFNQLNPAINLDIIPALIPVEPIPWPSQTDKPRIAGVSSFGISGTDGHVILQEPPTMSQPTKHEVYDNAQRPLHIMKISAKSPESFKELISKYENIFTAKEEESEGFADMAYSANIGRSNFNHRAVVIAKDYKDAAKILRNKSFKQVEVQSGGSQLCFLFTGQGSQYPKMGQSLYNTSPIFRDAFQQCERVLMSQYGINLREVLWGQSSSEAELGRSLYSQTSIFCIEYCLLQLWMSWGVKPDYVMGHSLGEFAAAVAAGALDFEDALMLVAERSRLIDNLPKGKMLVIQADKETVAQTINSFKQRNPNFWVDHAAINSPDQTVVAGDSEMIEEFANYCKEKCLKTTLLAASHAFHSRRMEPMLEAYRQVAQTVKTKKLKKNAPKYISGVQGKLVGTESIDAEYWVRHTREPVSFIDACKVAESEGCSLFLEVGPHPVLSALTMMNYEGRSVTCLPSLRKKRGEWETLLDSLATLYLSEWKGEVDWKDFDLFYNRSRIPIPFYPFNRKPIWKKLEGVLPTIHPLLGKRLPTASNGTIFENKITLKNTPFIQDHVIGNMVIFPGAAFLEMCLVGGHTEVQGVSISDQLGTPQRPIELDSLKIVSPLALYDSVTCRLQTTVQLDMEDKDNICYSIGVHRHVPSSPGGSSGEWILHAIAKFLPIQTQLAKEQHNLGNMDIPALQSSWEETSNTEFYERLPEVGLHFGPKFQTLQSAWKHETGMLFTVKTLEEEHTKYLIHPVYVDAMLQATMAWENKDDKVKRKLQVPVQIGKFIWLRASSSSSAASTQRFILCQTGKDGKTECTLLDEGGTRLAYVTEIDFIETTVKLVEGMIHQQETAMPNLWKGVWKSDPGPLQSAYDFATTADAPIGLSDEHKRFLSEANDIGDHERSFHNNLCNLARLYFLNCLYELGWKPQPGAKFTAEELAKLTAATPKEHIRKYIRFFLHSLADAGMVTKDADVDDDDDARFYFPGLPPTPPEIELGLQCVTSLEDITRVEYQMTVAAGRNLSQVWLDKINPLQLLFPEDPSKPNVGQFYEAMSKWVFPSIIKVTKDLVLPRLDACYAASTGSKQSPPPCVRLLEVGSGTGVFSKHYIGVLAKRGKPFEYHFTDISPSFFNAAATTLENHLKNVVFKKLDMEKDPLAQGFCPQYFDVILASEVLHVAKDVRKILRNLRKLLKPGGLFQILESSQPCPKVTQVFGLFEGYWQFEDYDLRPLHATLSPEKWEHVLGEVGCSRVISAETYNNAHNFITAISDKEESIHVDPLAGQQFSWVLFYTDWTERLAKYLKSKLEHVNRKVCIVERPPICTEEGMKILMYSELQRAQQGVEYVEGVIYLWGVMAHHAHAGEDQRNQGQISLPFVNLLQGLPESKILPRVYVVTQGTAAIDGFEVTNPAAGTLHGILKSVTNENSTLHLSCIDFSPRGSVERMAAQVFNDLWAIDKENRLVAFREDERLSTKLVRGRVLNNEPLSLPNGCARFQLLLPSSKQISDLEFGPLEKFELKGNDVEVEVKAMALNFRDVFTVLKPTAEFERLKMVGLDYSGVITRLGSNVRNWKIGESVIGMNMGNELSLPSHIPAEDEQLVPLPSSFTYCEGVTLPAVFSTAVYCLIKVGKMKGGDTLLIHTASGGVGLCAIQLAKRIGAEVIATAGSKRKRNYLRNLGIRHVFHSRNTDFGKQILEVTDGRGVDIVLNSLTGEGFKEASLSALAEGGQFIEMSKLNVWSPEEVGKLRPDVFYKVADLTSLAKSELQELIEELKAFLEADHIHPIPYERFDCLNIRGALNYLQRAKHIGKIVCVMPEVNYESSKLIATTPLFNPVSTYLVTGGLGGIGFEIVKWMLNSGAKHIAIVSRSQPSPEVASRIESWNNKHGKHVEAFSVDIGDWAQCLGLFQQLKSTSRGFPQLRGVMHAAGVIADGLFENQSWAKFQHTYNAKVNGTWNLHELTKGLLLEHFVLFSSIAASFGSPGQANHSASNSFEDALAAYRNSNGLPATTINWGNWGEIGIATEIDFPGIRPISTSQGLLALETFLKTQSTNMSVVNLDTFGLAIKMFPSLKHYVEDKRLLGDQNVTIIINSDEFWKDVDNAEDRDGKLMVFKRFIKTTLKNILKIDQSEEIDDLTEFQSLGVDSLMMLEMKNGLQNILGARMTLSASQLKDCSNTKELANRLVDILEGEGDHSKVELPTLEQLQKLVREDSILPDHIRPNDPSETVNEIENVLLTGATGVLGPYLLSELSRRPEVKKIYCLIRQKGRESPSERLLKRLQLVGIEDQVDMAKVECIQGDITDPRFGLSEPDYNQLAMNVEAIINSAVRSDHTAKYYKAPEKSKSDIRSVNVKGTLRILEFGVEGKLKWVFHASTLLSIKTTDENDCLSEEWQDVGVFDQFPVNPGYPLSKHVAEQLCKQAVERGIPCKTFRFPAIGGNSKTGRCDYLTNHVVLRWLTYLKLKCMPDMASPLVVMPVDHCAQISLDIFFNPGAPNDVYNVAHQNGGMDQSLIGIAEELGITIEPVSFSAFVTKLKLEKDDDSPLGLFKKMYEDEEAVVTQNSDGGNDPALRNFIQKYVENKEEFFRSRKLSQFVEEYDELESTEMVIRRDVSFLKESGIFDKFGIH